MLESERTPQFESLFRFSIDQLQAVGLFTSRTCSLVSKGPKVGYDGQFANSVHGAAIRHLEGTAFSFGWHIHDG